MVKTPARRVPGFFAIRSRKYEKVILLIYDIHGSF